jgi:hypothetical protein
MAKVEELSRKQAADRRAALLGLAADRSAGQQGDCLTSREMSELLEEHCSTEQRRRFLVHLSSCDPCYREWLELQQLLEAKAAPLTPLFFRRKALTVTGSLLAAAASVIFYLNIDNSPGPHGPPVLSSPEADTAMEESLERASEPFRQKAEKGRELPAPLVMERQESESVQVQSEPVRISEKKGVKAKDDAVQSFSAVSNQAGGVLPGAPAMVPDPVQQWLQLVKEKCSGLHSGQDWSLLAGQGRMLQVTDPFPQLPAILGHVERLANNGDHGIECAAIKKIIKDSPKENHDQ